MTFTMNFMFYSCEQLISVDLSNFVTPVLTDMSYMFSRLILKLSFLLILFSFLIIEILPNKLSNNATSIKFINF